MTFKSQKKHQTIDWIKLDKILILDFGSQYTQLIARRIREMNVFCEIHPYDVSLEKINDFSPKAIILSGGPNSVYEDETPKAPLTFTLSSAEALVCKVF